MTIFQMICQDETCRDRHDEWARYDEVKDGIPCIACGTGTKRIEICAAFIPAVPTDGVWRMEVRSKDVGRVGDARYKGEEIRVVDDGAKQVR